MRYARRRRLAYRSVSMGMWTITRTELRGRGVGQRVASGLDLANTDPACAPVRRPSLRSSPQTTVGDYTHYIFDMVAPRQAAGFQDGRWPRRPAIAIPRTGRPAGAQASWSLTRGRPSSAPPSPHQTRRTVLGVRRGVGRPCRHRQQRRTGNFTTCTSVVPSAVRSRRSSVAPVIGEQREDAVLVGEVVGDALRRDAHDGDQEHVHRVPSQF